MPARLGKDLAHALRFARAVLRTMERDRGGFGFAPRERRTERDRARIDVLLRREKARKMRIGPIDQARMGAEVRAQRERLQGEHADAAPARLQVEPYLRFAKAVDGLHGIAYQEKGAAVIGFPAGSQPFEQRVLRRRRILEFVDQDVPDAMIEGQHEIGRLALLSQGPQSCELHGAEIDPARFGERELEPRGSVGQQVQQCLDDSPSGILVSWRGQAAHPDERFAEARQSGERLDHGARRLLHRFAPGPFRTARARRSRKAQCPAEAHAPLVLLGQDERAHAFPCRARIRLTAREIVCRGEGSKAHIARVGQVGVGIAGKRAQVRRELARQHGRCVGERERDLLPQRLFDLCPQVAARGLRDDMLQPLIAPRQHVGQQLEHRFNAVVEMSQQREPGAPQILTRRVGKGAAGCAAIQGPRVLHDRGHGAEAGSERHAARDAGAERVDGQHRQARRMLDQVPSPLVVVVQSLAGELPGRPALRIERLAFVACLLQRAQQTLAHFRGGLDGEGDGENFVRPLHDGEELQHAPDEELSLARARGSLHDEGAAGIECALALRAIGLSPHRCHFLRCLLPARARDRVAADRTIRNCAGISALRCLHRPRNRAPILPAHRATQPAIRARCRFRFSRAVSPPASIATRRRRCGRCPGP